VQLGRPISAAASFEMMTSRHLAIALVVRFFALGAACSGAQPPELARGGLGERAATLAASAREAGRPIEQDPPGETVITVQAIGDCAIGDLRRGRGAPGSFQWTLGQVSEPWDYPFSGVVHLLRADDLTIANLEGTLTDHDGWTNPVFSIRGKPEYAQILARGSVELVDIDNNHTGDYGLVGHEQTKRSLEAAGVGFFGRGRVDRRTIRGVRVANLGYLGGPKGTRERVEREVAREKRHGGLVIVSFHWGVEGWSATHPDQQRLGRAAIDAGADLVLGHHPHVLQGIETYRGRHIVYSLGNFVFGANSTPSELDSIIYQERFRLRHGELVGVEQRIIPVRISSLPRQNDYRPVVLEGQAAERVLGKLEQLSRTLAPASEPS